MIEPSDLLVLPTADEAARISYEELIIRVFNIARQGNVVKQNLSHLGVIYALITREIANNDQAHSDLPTADFFKRTYEAAQKTEELERTIASLPFTTPYKKSTDIVLFSNEHLVWLQTIDEACSIAVDESFYEEPKKNSYCAKLEAVLSKAKNFLADNVLPTDSISNLTAVVTELTALHNQVITFLSAKPPSNETSFEEHAQGKLIKLNQLVRESSAIVSEINSRIRIQFVQPSSIAANKALLTTSLLTQVKNFLDRCDPQLHNVDVTLTHAHWNIPVAKFVEPFIAKAVRDADGIHHAINRLSDYIQEEIVRDDATKSFAAFRLIENLRTGLKSYCCKFFAAEKNKSSPDTLDERFTRTQFRDQMVTIIDQALVDEADGKKSPLRRYRRPIQKTFSNCWNAALDILVAGPRLFFGTSFVFYKPSHTELLISTLRSLAINATVEAPESLPTFRPTIMHK